MERERWREQEGDSSEEVQDVEVWKRVRAKLLQ